jgi:hypothetical protein
MLRRNMVALGTGRKRSPEGKTILAKKDADKDADKYYAKETNNKNIVSDATVDETPDSTMDLAAKDDVFDTVTDPKKLPRAALRRLCRDAGVPASIGLLAGVEQDLAQYCCHLACLALCCCSSDKLQRVKPDHLFAARQVLDKCGDFWRGTCLPECPIPYVDNQPCRSCNPRLLAGRKPSSAFLEIARRSFWTWFRQHYPQNLSGRWQAKTRLHMQAAAEVMFLRLCLYQPLPSQTYKCAWGSAVEFGASIETQVSGSFFLKQWGHLISPSEIFHMEGRLMQLQLCSIHFPTFPKRLTGNFLRQHLHFAQSDEPVNPLLLKLCRAALVTVLPTTAICEKAAYRLATDIMVRAQHGGCLMNSVRSKLLQ